MSEKPEFSKPLEYCSCLKTNTKILLDEVLTKYIELVESQIIEIEENAKKNATKAGGLSSMVIQPIPIETIEQLNEMRENVRRARITKVWVERIRECAF